MVKSNFIYIISILFILLYNQFKAQTKLDLNYDTFIKNVIDNNPLSKKANNSAVYGAYQLKAARGKFDPMVNASYENKFFNNTHYYTNSYGEIKQQLYTSQFLKAGYDYGAGTFVNNENKTSSPLPFAGVEVGLLQGMFIDEKRASVLKAKEYVQFYNADKNIQLNYLLYESAITYFDWLYSNSQLTIYNNFIDIARVRYKGLESLSLIGERASIDTIEAAIFLQGRVLDYQNLKILNQKRMAEVVSFNWVDFKTPYTNTIIETSDEFENYFNRAKQFYIKLLNTDTINNPIIEQYKAKQSILEIEQRLKKEMIKPTLNVSYNFLSGAQNSINPQFLSTNNYKWGANLSFPLFLRNATNDYKLSKLVVDNTRLELGNKSNELNLKLLAIKQNTSVIIEQLMIAERTAQYSKQLLDAEKLKFDNGESSLFLLNTRENKWMEFELKVIDYKLKFINNVLNAIYINGNLNYSLQ